MMKNLIICENLKYPLDEGATKLTVEFIKFLEGKTIIINFGEKLKIKNVTIIPIFYSNFPILGFIFGRLLSLVHTLKIKPDNTYYFPLCPPKIINQIYASILSKLTRNFKEVLYQIEEIKGPFKLFSKFNIGVISKIRAESLTKKGLMVEYISIPFLKPKEIYEKEKLREKYEIQKDDFVVLHVGHAENDRGLGVLSELQEIMPNIKIVLVLSSRKKIKKDVLNPKIRIINRYIDDIYEVFAIADTYLFPIKSRKAAIDIPLSVIEAKEMNLPIIVSDNGLMKEALADYPKGYLIEIGNEKEMAREIKRILEKIMNK
jgi:glycosyltransferase involved in cell wall biosynthesis